MLKALIKHAKAFSNKGVPQTFPRITRECSLSLSIEIKRINQHKLDLLFYKLQDTQWSLYWKAHLLSGIEPW